MIKRKLSNGFECTIEDEALDNYELLETLAEIDRGNLSLVIKVAPMVLGKDQVDRLKEHIRNDHGIVPATKMVEALGEILSGDKEGKN